MSPTPTLHCYPGDGGSLGALLLADYLGAELSTRFLKPINITERIYKKSATKTFPMLDLGADKMIERTPAILRYLARVHPSPALYEGLGDHAVLVDEHLDSFYYIFAPSFALQAAHFNKLVQLSGDQAKAVFKKVQEGLSYVEKACEKTPQLEANIFDFYFIAVLHALSHNPEVKSRLKGCKAIKQRYEKLGADEKFAKVAAPYLSIFKR